MRRLLVCLAIAAFIAVICVVAVRSTVLPGAVVGVALPTTHFISLPKTHDSLSAVTTSLGQQSGLKFELHESARGDMDALIPQGSLPLWSWLGEFSVRNNLFVYYRFNGFQIASTVGQPLGYSTAGPALLVLHADAAETPSARRRLWVGIHFHPYELHKPEILKLSLRNRAGKWAEVKCAPRAADGGLEAWELDGEYDLAADAEEMDCLIRAKVRTKLYRAILPFGKNSSANIDDITIYSDGMDDSNSTMPAQKFKITWNTGLKADDERRLSELIQHEFSGIRETDEEIAWFHQHESQIRRVVVVESEGVFDRAGNEVTPSNYASQDVDANHVRFQAGGDAKKSAGGSVHAILGREAEQELVFKINRRGEPAR